MKKGKEHYEAPWLWVEEVVLMESFLGGSHEDFSNPNWSHETMEERNDELDESDFTFTE